MATGREEDHGGRIYQSRVAHSIGVQIGVGADAVSGGAAGGVGNARPRRWMKRPLLTRWDVIFVVIATAGIATPLLALTQKPSGWVLLLDAILSAGLGLLSAAVVAFAIRFFGRWPKDR